MKTYSVPNGTYSEATTDERWVSQVGAIVQTSWGDIAAPANGLLTVRLSSVAGSHRLCGHEHHGPHVVVYEADHQWHIGAQTISGAMSAAFGPTGRLYWAPDYNSVQGEGLTEPLVSGENVAGGGIRHVVSGPDGVDLALSKDATNFDQAQHIWEYTTIGDVTVGQGGDGGVLVLHNGLRYLIDSGHCWYVRFNRDGDKLAIAYWKLHDGVAKFLWLTVAELSQFPQEDDALPPLDAVPMLNRPFGLVCYTFNNHTSWGNLKIPIRPTEPIGIETRTIATVDDHAEVWDIDLFAIYSGEGDGRSSEDVVADTRPIGIERKRGLSIYQDSYPMRESVIALVESHDLATPQIYRNQNELLGDYNERLYQEYFRVANALTPGAECWPTVNIHQRYSPSGPTLSVKEVVTGFIAACERAEADNWPGMVLFRVGTSDVPDEAWPYVERFMSGITGVPEPREIPDTPEPPEEPSMASIGKRLTDAFTSVKEIDVGNGEVALELPEPINGFRKIKCTTPDGNDEFRPTENRDWQQSDIRTWERYKKTPTAYVAERDGHRAYVYPRA